MKGESEEGGGFDPYAVYPQATPHPSLPPPDGGRDRVAVTEKGRLKNLFRAFQTTYLADANGKYLLRHSRAGGNLGFGSYGNL